MKLEKISIKNVGPIREKEVDVKDGITAFVGQLGTGKTMALEMPFVTTFLEFATRSKKIQDYVRGGALISTTWDKDNQKLNFTLKVDKESVQGEISINGDTKSFATQSQYLSSVEPYFPPKNLWLSTVLCAQTKVGSFVELTKTPRKEIFYQILNLAQYENIADKANEKSKTLTSESTMLEGKLSVIKDTIKNYESALSENKFADLKQLVETQQKLLEMLSAEVVNYPTYHALKDQISYISKELESIKLDSFPPEIKDFNSTKATERLAIISDNISTLQKQLNDYQTIVNELAEIEKQANEAKKYISETVSDEEIKALKEEYIKLTNTLPQISADIKAIKAKISELQSRKLYKPPCGDLFANCELKQDLINTVKQLEEYQQKLKQFPTDDELKQMYTHRMELEKKITNYDKNSKLIWKINSLREQYKSKKNILNNLVISTEELKKIAENRLNKLINEKELLSKNINLSIQYNESVTKHKTLQKQLEELTSKLKAIKYDEAKEKQYNELSQSLPQLKNQLATLTEKNRQLQELKSQQESLEKNLKDLKQDLSEYIIISDMCGPNGIPSIKIDAVIPEVESIANNLLQESNWGYQIRLETQKESVQKNKYKILETLEIVVLDETDGLTKLVSDLSVGQRSVISEAINLALAIIAKQKGVIDIETLFRDETTSNLNREAATNYVKLLRNAMNMGGFKNLIYITHQDFLLSQMDHVVNFER